MIDSPRARRVLARARSVPAGFVATYGVLSPGAPRFTGAVLAACEDGDVPWHRVVRADGTLAKGPRQRRLLEAEGVPFRGSRVDMELVRVAGQPLPFPQESDARRGEMSLSRFNVGATVAVSDMGRAKEFYEGKLGLANGDEKGDGGTTYPCEDGTSIHVYPSPDNAGKSGATLAAFRTDDLESVVDELAGKGVEFERYDTDPIRTDEKGIARLDETKVAWFKDPDGNILAVGEG